MQFPARDRRWMKPFSKLPASPPPSARESFGRSSAVFRIFDQLRPGFRGVAEPSQVKRHRGPSAFVLSGSQGGPELVTPETSQLNIQERGRDSETGVKGSNLK